jgi:hypothetical protein
MCGDFGHSRNECLKTQVDVWYNNYNGFYPQGDPGWNRLHLQNQEGNYAHSNYVNQPLLKDLVLGQAQMNENLTKKLASSNEIFENINSNSEGLNFSFKSQLFFNEMFENPLAQGTALIPAYDFEKDLGATQNFI